MRATAFLMLLAASIVWSPTAEAQSPSFDCRKARYPDEFAICRTPELAELDNLVAAAYAYLKATRGRPYADQIGIPFWRLRQACQSDTLCIKERQVEALNAYRNAGAPVPRLEEIKSPSPEPQPAPSAESREQAPHEASSGTGVFVTNEGHLVTNAHVVKDCLDIRVGTGEGDFEEGKLIAKDPTNDLALLKVNAKRARVGALRFGARQGENVEAFGYPLSQVLATSGNFTTGIVTALAGVGDDSRFYQVSAPVQPGNSGGPLLDENGNLIGIVSAKLNPFSEIKTQGDIPQNVNFAIKATVVANFLQDNAIKFAIGEATEAMKGPDLADEAKAFSAFIVCR